VSITFVYALALISSVGVFAAQIVLSLYALHLGAGPLAVGALAGTFALFPMSLAVASGRLIDRHGARWPMTFGATAGGIGMLIPHFFPVLPALYAAAALAGLSIIFFNLATQNLVGLLSTTETRPRNFSNYTLVNSTANFLGPLAGGFMIDHTDHATTCLALAVLSLLSLTLLAVYGSRLPGGTHHGPKASSGGGVREMLADPFVRRTLVTGSLLNAGMNMFTVYIPVYGHSIGLSASAIGTVLAMNAAAAFVVRFWLPDLIRKLGEQKILAYAFFSGATSLLLFPLIHIAAGLALLAFGFGLGMGGGQPIVIMQMFANSKDGRSGEALGLKFATNQLTKLLTPVLFGAVAAAAGLLSIFWLNSALMAFGGVMSRDTKRDH